MNRFVPHRLRHEYDNGIQAYGDDYAWVTAQLGSTLQSLIRFQSEVQFTPADLANYFGLQFGVHHTDTARKIVDARYDEPDGYRQLPGNELFYEHIDSVISPTTLPAAISRIALTNTDVLKPGRFREETKGLAVLTHDTDEFGVYQLSLKPWEEGTMTYTGTVPVTGSMPLRRDLLRHAIDVVERRDRTTLMITTEDYHFDEQASLRGIVGLTVHNSR